MLAATAASGYAKLPELDKAPWFGQFAAYDDRHSRFTFSGDAKIEIRPVVDKKMLGAGYAMRIGFAVRETMPDGREFMRGLDPEQLTTDDAPSAEFDTFTVRGKTKQGIAVEIVVAKERNGYRIGGRLVDPPQGGKSRHEFVVQTRFDDFYRHVQDPEAKKHLGNIKDDELKLRLANGSRERLPMGEKLENPEAVKAMDIREAELEMYGLRGTSVEFAASDKSRLRIQKDNDERLNKGFRFSWTADADPAAATATEWMEVVIK